MRRRAFTLASDSVSRDTVECLDELMDMAQKGELIGFTYAAMLRNRNFFVDATGEADRNPTFSRGMIRALDDELCRRVHDRQVPQKK